MLCRRMYSGASEDLAGSNLADLIRRELMKNVDQASSIIIEKAEYALAKHWGSNTDWHEIRVKDVMLDIIAW